MLLPFSDIRNWIRNIEQHASDNVNKILVGNKADMDESKRVWTMKYISFWGISDVAWLQIVLRILWPAKQIIHLLLNHTFICLQAVPTAKGQALADEYGIKFFETVSKYPWIWIHDP